MNNQKTFWSIIVILIIIAGLYIVVRKHPTPVVVPDTNTTTTAPTIATYFCSEGSIVATFDTKTVTLGLSDGRSLTLPQVMSGSGIRYESGTTVFSSEGNNAFLTENAATTFSNCVAGTQSSSGTKNTFVDPSKLFSFDYPNTLTLSGGEQGYTQSWRQGTQQLGLVLAVATLPQSFQPKTNFSEAKFSVGTSSDTTAVNGCLTQSNGNGGTATNVTINGTQFSKITENDAGAGNFYQTTSYRTVKNHQCYAIEYTIHSTNLGNYDPSQGITAYDQTKVQNVLDGIVQSFTFL